MSEPLAYLNGEFVPSSRLAVPVFDSGFLMGVTVAERLRTFGGQLFRLPEHLERLSHSLEIVGIDTGLSEPELAEIARRIASENHKLLADGDDLGLSIFVTPGLDAGFAATMPVKPTICVHTYPLAFHLWHEKYEQGQALVATQVRQVPPECWPPELKCRSRMHYYLADREAARRERGARALLLDAADCVSEASTANIVVYRRDEGLLSPPLTKILPGISLAVLAELAHELEIPVNYRDLTVDDVARADEAMLCSTSPCIQPVVRFNSHPIGTGVPGDVYRRLLRAWSEHVGLDIAAQAVQFATRQSTT